MTTVRDIMNTAERIAPLSLQAEWDNSGLLIGSSKALTEKVLLALDITPEVVEEARALKASLIISHHPVIFHPLSTLQPDSAAYLLAKYDIAALCLHTNLDRAQEGVNTALANALGLKNIRTYPEDYLAVGELDTLTPAKAFAEQVKSLLHAPDVRYTDGKIIKTVAVSSGAGGEQTELYERYGFDALVTGELKHHQYLYAREHSIAVFDAGHHPTEEVVLQPLCSALRLAHPTVTFLLSCENPCPYKTV